jgi:monoterpene epsilon-lactone hydrolase
MASPEFDRVIEVQKALGVFLDSEPEMPELRARWPQLNPLPFADDLEIAHDKIGEIPVEIITPPEVDGDRTILYCHQGAFVMGAAWEFRGPIGELGRRARARVVVPDYRLSPEHPYPAAVEDMLAAWRWLLDSGTPAASVVIAGDSAGGNLCVATMLAAREAGDPLPAGGVSLSAYLDMDLNAESFERNRASDPLISKEACEGLAAAYLGGADPRDPIASPVWAELTGLPPLYISSGTAEVLFDDGARLAENARRDGVEVTYEPVEDMVHMWYLYVHFLPEADVSLTSIAAFVRDRTMVLSD